MTTARARGVPSLILIATPRPSGRPTACTASAPALVSRPGIARCSWYSSRRVPEVISGWVRMASAIRRSGPLEAAARRPNERASAVRLMAKAGAPQPSTAIVLGDSPDSVGNPVAGGQLDGMGRVAVVVDAPAVVHRGGEHPGVLSGTVHEDPRLVGAGPDLLDLAPARRPASPTASAAPPGSDPPSRGSAGLRRGGSAPPSATRRRAPAGRRADRGRRPPWPRLAAVSGRSAG